MSYIEMKQPWVYMYSHPSELKQDFQVILMHAEVWEPLGQKIKYSLGSLQL